MKAEIIMNYKRYKNRFTKKERTEQASFDTDRSSFTKEAEPLIEVLGEFVENARSRRR
jgi:hypothetical protein